MTTTQTMTATEVANRLVELCRQGKNMDAIKELYADNIESIEPIGSRHPHTEGKANVMTKQTEFFSMVEEVHSSEVSNPSVAANYFTLTMKMDMTLKGRGRMAMDEVCVYKVLDGKIVHEQFIFDVMPM
ncbi:MAG: nuclear transport factor 2 family protein [Bacteroidia bacterium]